MSIEEVICERTFKLGDNPREICDKCGNQMYVHKIEVEKEK